MICKYCGSEIDDGSDFCYICGQKVEPVAPAFVPVNNAYNVEPAPMAAEAPVAEPVAAPVVAEAPAAPVAAVAEPVVAAPAEYQTQVPPSFAAPVASEAPVEAPAGKKAKKKKEKKEKKAKKVKNPSAASKAVKFFSFLFALIGLILYRKAKKSGNEAKAVEILNALMTGLCVKMAIVSVVLAKKYMFS